MATYKPNKQGLNEIKRLVQQRIDKAQDSAAKRSEGMTRAEQADIFADELQAQGIEPDRDAIRREYGA